MKSFETFLGQFNHFRQNKTPIVVATMVDIVGSAPQEIGARCIIGLDGLLYGTIGGGKVETFVIDYAKKILLSSRNESHLQKWNLQKDIGMTCGGVVSIFFEAFPVKTSWKIAIFGAGHVSQALVRLLAQLECSISVFDSRQEWLDRLPQAPQVEAVLSSEMSKVVQEISLDHFVVIMTMGHAVDLPILAQAVQRGFPYVGNMGSETKARVLREDLKKQNISIENISKFYCPIGEQFGNNTPAEIALSVAAQLLRVRDQTVQTSVRVSQNLAQALL